MLAFLGQAVKGDLARHVILRLLPTESVSRWQEGLRNDNQIEIVEDSDHLAKIAANSVLVRTCCTTGLEAAILGTPALNIVTERSPWPSSYIARIANTCITNTMDTVSIASTLVKHPNASFAGRGRSPTLQDHLLMDETSAAEKVADALAHLHAKS